MRFGLGIVLLTVIALGLAWLLWPAVRRRLPGADKRRAHMPQEMIDIALDRDPD